MTAHGYYASGQAGSPTCSAPGEHDPRTHTRCPAADQRLLAYGLLGPAARSIIYRAAGRDHRLAVPGPDGAYLIVVRDHARLGGIGMGPLPGPPVRTYSYDNGLLCHPGGPRCGPVGYVAPPTPNLSPKQLRVPITVRLSRFRHARVAVLMLDVAFDAPVAITSSASFYDVTAQLPRACGANMFSLTSSRNLRRGERVHIRMPVPASGCSGTIHGRVTLQVPANGPAGPPPPTRPVPPGTGRLVAPFHVTAR
jgi:hypothetical protein